MTDQEKAFHSLQKSFFELESELAQYKRAGINPPKHLLQLFEQTKRRLHIFSKACERNN
jgi:hypothetical protein